MSMCSNVCTVLVHVCVCTHVYTVHKDNSQREGLPLGLELLVAAAEGAWPLVVVVQVHLLVARAMGCPAQPPRKGGGVVAADADSAYSVEREAEWGHWR